MLVDSSLETAYRGWNLPAILAFLKPIEMEDLPWNWLCFKKHQPWAILDTLQKTRVTLW